MNEDINFPKIYVWVTQESPHKDLCGKCGIRDIQILYPIVSQPMDVAVQRCLGLLSNRFEVVEPPKIFGAVHSASKTTVGD